MISQDLGVRVPHQITSGGLRRQPVPTREAERDSLAQAEAFTIPVGVIRDPERFAKAYKVHGAPLTLVVEQGGRVEGAWLGMVDDAKKQEIMEAVTLRISAER